MDCGACGNGLMNNLFAGVAIVSAIGGGMLLLLLVFNVVASVSDRNYRGYDHRTCTSAQCVASRQNLYTGYNGAYGPSYTNDNEAAQRVQAIPANTSGKIKTEAIPLKEFDDPTIHEVGQQPSTRHDQIRKEFERAMSDTPQNVPVTEPQPVSWEARSNGKVTDKYGFQWDDQGG